MCGMGEQQILTFDTSAINKLADEKSFDLLMAYIRERFCVQVSFDSVEEIVATSSARRRRQLLCVCNRLLADGTCIDPAGPLLQKMVARFERDAGFDWAEVNVGVCRIPDLISHSEGLDDCLAKQVREERKQFGEAFTKVYREAKPRFNVVLAFQETEAPKNPAALVNRLQSTFWKTASNIYARHAKKPFDETTIQRFVQECDPLRALVNAFFVAAFDKCVRPPRSATSFRSGFGDTLMSVCLPYCNYFVTNDTNGIEAGGQLAFYQEICSLAGLKHVTVQSYDKFRQQFSEWAVLCSAR